MKKHHSSPHSLARGGRIRVRLSDRHVERRARRTEGMLMDGVHKMERRWSDSVHGFEMVYTDEWLYSPQKWTFSGRQLLRTADSPHQSREQWQTLRWICLVSRLANLLVPCSLSVKPQKIWGRFEKAISSLPSCPEHLHATLLNLAC